MFPPVGNVRFFGHVLEDAVKKIRISLRAWTRFVIFKLFVYYSWQTLEWKSEAEVQSMRERH